MMRTKPEIQRRVVVAVALLAIAGCGDANTSTVTGAVTHNGAPLPTGEVIFVPETGRQATGRITDGRIVDVTTVEPGDGAPIGRNRVAVFSFTREPDRMEVAPSAIPTKYNDPATSGLTVEITAEGPNDVTLELVD